MLEVLFRKGFLTRSWLS